MAPLWTTLRKRLNRPYDEFQAYQRSLPYKTVVPEPPHSLGEHLAAALWRWSTRLLFLLLACLSAPLWLSLHLLLLLWDRYQRRQWRIYQEAWPHLSLPHVRPVRYPADPSFSIDQWHLRCEDGRQRWFFGSTPATAEEGNAYTTAQMARAPRTTTSDAKEPTQAELRHTMEEKRQWLERYQLGLQPAEPTQRRERAADAMRDGAAFLLKLQDPFSGHWPNDYSGCQFLTPGVVFAKFIVAGGDLSAMFPPCETPHAPPETTCRCGEASRLELIRYLRNYQNEDGGWGQHTEGHSTMLGTVLSYITLRLLGTPAEDAQVAKARVWIQEAGGATYTPMWGKVWLSVLGLYSWDGVDPIPPELALLPHWVPFSVGRSWCHSRVLSVPFSYLYGLRWSAPPHPLLTALKTELYAVPFDSINWRSCRGRICSTDLYTPPSSFFKLAGKLMSLYECYPIGPIRRYALELNWKYMAYDDENTNFICLGPVNKSLNMLITWLREGPKSTRYHMHQQRVADYFYMGPEGMRMSGYNGSQLWDTSFAVQALCACRLQHQHTDSVALAHHYVDVAQVQEDPIAADFFFRHRTKGAWNFSTRSQGWQVSDCTAEGLRVALLLPHLPFPTSRVYDGVDEILSLRNRSGDGGWASYEPSRAPAYCELFNCAELFKDVMIDYSYAECSSSCVHSLSLFRQQHPTYRRREVDTAISEGIACILSKQRRDGSFYGSWAVCFTYGAWIVADALRVSGELSDMANHPHCRRLVDFLLLHQNADGGWGEDVNACVRQVWVNNADGSQVVNTAWAVMAIMNACGSAECSSLPRRKKIVDAVEGGVGLIMARQLRSGDWRQERISGVFNGNNPIHYPGYKNCMPVWALGRYLSWKEEYAKDCSNGQQA